MRQHWSRRFQWQDETLSISLVQYVRKFVNQSLVQAHVGWKFMEWIKFLSLYQGVNKWSIFFMYMFLFQILTFFVTFREMHWSFFHSLNNLVEKNIKKWKLHKHTLFVYVINFIYCSAFGNNSFNISIYDWTLSTESISY